LAGFTNRERLLGDQALAQIKMNFKNTCRNFKHLLGLNIDSPGVQEENQWCLTPLVEHTDGNVGYQVSYKGMQHTMPVPVITAMFLTKLRDITEKWCQSKLVDVVIGVPAYFSDVHRKALLDAAKIAGISVLRLMNEHTATALAYGIYRTANFHAENPITVAFCSMGHSIFSVSIVQFIRGKLKVLCEKSDKVGGRDMDFVLMKHFAAEFEKKYHCNPLNNKRSFLKLEDSVAKTKKTLSANNEAGIACESLMEDEDLMSQITRDVFVKMCEPLMARVKVVLENAITASGIPVTEIESVEIVGGATRVPWVKELCSQAFGGAELATTLNADECVARGCALQAAMLSPLFKVREFQVEDTSPFAISIGWMASSGDPHIASNLDDDGDHTMVGPEGELKSSVVFPANSTIGSKKMLTFKRKSGFDLKIQHTDATQLIPGTSVDLGIYRIDLPDQSERKDVKVKAALTLHGTVVIDTAQVHEEVEYEEVVKEKRELPPSPAEDEKMEEAAAAEGDAEMATENAEGGKDENKEGDEKSGADAPMPDEQKDTEKKPEKKPEKKYEWVDVVKMKRRTKKTDIPIVPSGTPGMPDADIVKCMDEETAMQVEMREIVDMDEKRNDLESYIFTMRDKVSEHGEYGQFVSNQDRSVFLDDLERAENWLYDVEEPTKVMYVEKLQELKTHGDPVVWRFKEDGMRPDWVAAVNGTIVNYRAAANEPGERYGHIAEEKLASINDECEKTEKWLQETFEAQSKLPKHARPVLLCSDMEKKNQGLAKFADDILKEPKPAPPKPEPAKDEEAKEDSPQEPSNEEATASPAGDVD